MSDLAQARANAPAELLRANEQLRQELAECNRAREALRESEEKYRRVVENASEAIVVEQGGVLQLFNPALTDMTGYSQQELATMSLAELVHPEDRDLVVQRQALRLQGTQTGEPYAFRIVDKTGCVRWAEIRAVLVDWEGRPATLNFLTDITGRKQAEAREQSRRVWLEKVIELGKTVTQVVDWRSCLLKIHEIVRHELNFDRVGLWIFDEEAQVFRGSFGTSRTGELTEEWDWVLPLPAGEVFEGLKRYPDGMLYVSDYPTEYPLRPGDPMEGVTEHVLVGAWAGNRPIAFLSVDNFLTQRPMSEEQVEALRLFAGYAGLAIENARLLRQVREGEQMLRTSERLLHSLVDSLPQNIYSKDLAGRFTFVNQQFCRTENKTQAEILGKTDADLHPPDLAQKYRKDDLWVIENEQIFETVEEHQSLEGERFYVQVVKSPLYDGKGQVIGTLGIFWDVTERQRAEQLLQALNQASLAMEKALTQEEILAAAAEEFRTLGLACTVLAVDKDRSRLSIRHVSTGTPLGGTAGPLMELQQPGLSLPISQVPAYQRVIAERETLFIDDAAEVLRQVLPVPAAVAADQATQPLARQRAIAAPLIVGDEVIGLLCVQAADLTAADVPAITAFAHQMAAAWRKAQLLQDLENSLKELQQTQAQLVQAQKMQAIGRLAGGVAHDFNNLLTVVQINSQLLMQQLHPADPIWERVRQIQEAGARATQLTQQLLRFSRQEIVEPKVINLSEVIRDLSRMLQRVIGEDIHLVTDLAEDLWPVRADPLQIEQVIVNLAVNARDAMPQGGSLSIRTSNVLLDELSAAQRIYLKPGKYVQIAVSDTGVGMDEETQTRLFEPFFTTKEPGRGTGLGLSTAYGIVQQHGGHIWVYSELGKGSTFKIYLPCAGQAAVSREAPAKVGPSDTTQGSETVMLVEDETAVRHLAVEILKAQGYGVLAASNGAEALRLGAEHEGPIHLLVTDVIMPGMNGKELAERMRAQRPGLHVLYISGYSDDVIAHHDVLGQGVAFLAKPFSVDGLLQKIRAILADKADRAGPV